MKLRNTLFGALALGLVGISPVVGSAIAYAQEAQIVSQQAAQVDLTIFGNSYAQVEETRRLELKQGLNRVLLTGVAAKYRSDSLRLVGVKKGPGAVTVKSSIYQPATLTTERLLALSVGKSITVTNQTATTAGKLLAVQGGNLIIDTDGGAVEVVSAGGNIRFHETPADLTATSSLVLEVVADKAGAYDVTFIYETGGFGWTAKHSAIYDDAAGKLKSWESTVLLTNSSGTSFSNATVRLITGRVVAQEEAGGARMYSAAKASRQEDAAAVEDVGEQKVYVLPGKVALSDGQARLVPLFVANNVPVKRTYVVPGNAPYEGTASGFASVRLTVDNCLRDNMGKAIPAGVVKVYQFNADGNLLQTGAASTGDRTVDEIFDLVIGKASDIKYEVKTVSANPLPVKSDREQRMSENTVEVTVFNYKGVEVNAQIELAGVNTTKLDGSWTINSRDSASLVTKVAKGAQSKVRYLVVVPYYGN